MEEMSRSEQSEHTQANSEQRTAVYEVGFHVVPTISDADAAAVASKIRAAIEKTGAAVIAEETPKRMPFAYRIERSVQGKREKFTEGYFSWIKFEFDEEDENIGESVTSLGAMLRADSQVLRFLLIQSTRALPQPVRTVFSSDRLEGQTIEQPMSVAPESSGEISEEEIDKSIDALVGESAK